MHPAPLSEDNAPMTLPPPPCRPPLSCVARLLAEGEGAIRKRVPRLYRPAPKVLQAAAAVFWAHRTRSSP